MRAAPGAARQTPPTQTGDQQAAPLFRAASTWKPGSDIGVLPATLQRSAQDAGSTAMCKYTAFVGNVPSKQTAAQASCSFIGRAQ